MSKNVVQLTYPKCLQQYSHREMHNLVASHYHLKKRVREWGRKSEHDVTWIKPLKYDLVASDFHRQWQLFNNKDNSHDPTLLHYNCVFLFLQLRDPKR